LIKKKLVIFDLDGTLLDTIEDLANATNYALRCFDLPEHPVNAYRFFVGNGINKLLERALPEAQRNVDWIAMVRQEFLKYYTMHSEDSTRPYPGMVDLLKELQEQGIMLGVASNKIHDATVELVHRFFPGINFVAVLGQRDGIPVKPSPDILESIVNAAGTAKSETLYVGDSGVDAMTAIRAGISFVGVLWGFRPKEELAGAGAENFIEKPEELFVYL
jgi:phosphoglycolate phosphatase